MGALETQVLRLVNRERAQAGLKPLKPDAALVRAARAHSAEMRDMNYTGHDSPVPAHATVAKRLALAEISDATFGENVGSFASNSPRLVPADFARKLHDGLMKSPPHRANILNGAFNLLGIGIVLGEVPSEENPVVTLRGAWITQNFATRRLDLRPPEVERNAAGFRVVLRGTMRLKTKLVLFTRAPSGKEQSVEVAVRRGAFKAEAAFDAGTGMHRLDLAVGGKGTRYDVANSFLVDTDVAPEQAVVPGPGGD